MAAKNEIGYWWLSSKFWLLQVDLWSLGVLTYEFLVSLFSLQIGHNSLSRFVPVLCFLYCDSHRWESHRLRRRTTMRHTGGSPKLTSSQFSPNLIWLIPKLGSHCSKTDSSIWVKFLRAHKAWKWCHIFRIFGRPFRQFRGLESQEMKYILKIY